MLIFPINILAHTFYYLVTTRQRILWVTKKLEGWGNSLQLIHTHTHTHTHTHKHTKPCMKLYRILRLKGSRLRVLPFNRCLSSLLQFDDMEGIYPISLLQSIPYYLILSTMLYQISEILLPSLWVLPYQNYRNIYNYPFMQLILFIRKYI
jgi:hypothetical protein